MSYAMLITFESWVTHLEWYSYAKCHPAAVPHLLVDRSQCTDPFFDLFTPVSFARPLISGLCRPRRRYPERGRIVYLTRVDRRVLRELGRAAPTASGAVYFLVAALQIERTHPSHGAAADTFQPRRYVIEPSSSPYPPNLAHGPYPGASVVRESCITHDMHADPPCPHTPDTSTKEMHRSHYNFYRTRQRTRPVAECRFDDGALVVDPRVAPILMAESWDGRKINQQGLRIDQHIYGKLVQMLSQEMICGSASGRGHGQVP